MVFLKLSLPWMPQYAFSARSVSIVPAPLPSGDMMAYSLQNNAKRIDQMFHWIQHLLTERELTELDNLFDSAEYQPGRETAVGHAQQVKHNQQLTDSPERTRAGQIIIDALSRHDKVQHAALPAKIRPPKFARYTTGMSYGQHIDSPLANDGQSVVRSDLSVTVFLSDPRDYEGGELIVRTTLNDQMFKLPRGDALIYPATMLHRVAEVASGCRKVAVTWIESRIRDPRQRQILMDTERVRRRLATLDPDGDEADIAYQIHANLMRLWERT